MREGSVFVPGKTGRKRSDTAACNEPPGMNESGTSAQVTYTTGILKNPEGESFLSEILMAEKMKKARGRGPRAFFFWEMKNRDIAPAK